MNESITLAQVQNDDTLQSGIRRALYAAKIGEEIDALVAFGVSDLKEAVNIYRETVQSRLYQEGKRLYDDARHREAQALYDARQEGRRKAKYDIARNVIQMGLPVDDIIELTGLTREEVESLRTTDSPD